MANTNSKFYTNKDMAKACGVSESSMTNLVKSLGLTPVKTGKYGRKYYNDAALKMVKSHYSNKNNSVPNSARPSTKDGIIREQQEHINDLKAQIEVLNHQLAIKDRQIETQTEQVKQTSILLSQAHTLTLQAQNGLDDKSSSAKTTEGTPETPNDSHGLFWKWFH